MCQHIVCQQLRRHGIDDQPEAADARRQFRKARCPHTVCPEAGAVGGLSCEDGQVCAQRPQAGNQRTGDAPRAEEQDGKAVQRDGQCRQGDCERTLCRGDGISAGEGLGCGVVCRNEACAADPGAVGIGHSAAEHAAAGSDSVQQLCERQVGGDPAVRCGEHRQDERIIRGCGERVCLRCGLDMGNMRPCCEVLHGCELTRTAACCEQAHGFVRGHEIPPCRPNRCRAFVLSYANPAEPVRRAGSARCRCSTIVSIWVMLGSFPLRGQFSDLFYAAMSKCGLFCCYIA